MAISAFLFAFCVRPTLDSKRADVGRSVMACHLAISAPIGTISTKDNPVGFLLFRQARVGHAQSARFRGVLARSETGAMQDTPKTNHGKLCAKILFPFMSARRNIGADTDP